MAPCLSARARSVIPYSLSAKMFWIPCFWNQKARCHHHCLLYCFLMSQFFLKARSILRAPPARAYDKNTKSLACTKQKFTIEKEGKRSLVLIIPLWEGVFVFSRNLLSLQWLSLLLQLLRLPSTLERLLREELAA